MLAAMCPRSLTARAALRCNTTVTSVSSSELVDSADRFTCVRRAGDLDSLSVVLVCGTQQVYEDRDY